MSIDSVPQPVAAVRNGYEEKLHQHWEDKQSDDINLLLGATDGLYHHHYAVGDYNHHILDAAGDDRERLILREMHRMETEQVSLVTGALAGLSPNARVMDGGSGRGGTAFLVHEQLGCRVDGMNFCAHHNHFARDLAVRRQCADKVFFHDGNMVETPFADETFDAVYTNETTMYINLREAFTEFARVLRPGGRFVLVTWCRNDAETQFSQAVSAIDEHYVCHIHARSAYLRELLHAGMVPSQVTDLTEEAIPYWELRSHSRLKTGVEVPFLDAYRKNHLNYLVIAAEKSRDA
ncbi:SAM-dependent methyltransferase [Streptomyces sp. CB01201]|uniref:SAM-dependent methyltransferase n=1 Tax=Streptomyces sp. CB01201 TaxID=2020324 RepID=UPI000C276FD5|nr:methyltransferase domain-containing protein [Streptomyces sp. CB01201]PJM97979.1 SAM-dependent methyltransferase [Streptomyces sp. CB01201]